MSSIFLRKLSIENFKGIRSLEIDFSKVTNIQGENALGKTSIFDAFSWLMFDKDSKNRTTFDIKPLDENNTVIRGLNTTVTAVLDIDGTEIKLTKIYKEKWTKKRGEAEKTFTGNETIYEINDVPVKKTEYQNKISEIADEKQFKLLTNPYYFSDSLNWKDARQLILEVAGDITTDQVIDSKNELEPLRAELASQDIETVMKSKKATIKKLGDRKKDIPVRINECDRSIVDIDFKAIKSEVDELNDLLEYTEDKLLDSSKTNEQILKDKETIFSMKQRIQEINQQAINRGGAKKLELMDKLRVAENEVNEFRMKLITVDNEKKSKDYQRDTLTNEMNKLRAEFSNKQQENLDTSSIETECPTCKRAFETNDIEAKRQELLENFNLNKSKVLKDIQAKGIASKEKVEKITLELDELSKQSTELLGIIQEKNMKVAQIKEEIEKLKVEAVYLDTDKQTLESLNNDIADLEAKVSNPNDTNVEELRAKKREVINQINELNKTLAKEELNKDLEVRKQELLDEEKELGVEIAKQEKIVMLCELFIKTRVNMLESNINSKFKNVKFKLFKEQVNGGIDETCEALVNGVPFSNANTAGQINAGLDIIDTLSKHFDVQAPIFIDNRESVNNLIEIDSQIINLVVTKDNPLKIQNYSIEGVM
ncbi:MAG: AAA family ATPase [Paraclostridium bifermentans]|uniref:AAA family ATPase n=1 Tax=Paraclostridium bifermentans TaxID=1490 RepID=UPI00241CA24B|nr:AAA family ATPase [Paraclostridium bifermentans]MBS5952541.1 AAA family ATPase [Paraclostridium bifermentans]